MWHTDWPVACRLIPSYLTNPPSHSNKPVSGVAELWNYHGMKIIIQLQLPSHTTSMYYRWLKSKGRCTWWKAVCIESQNHVLCKPTHLDAGEQLTCLAEDSNDTNLYAVAMKKGADIIGHVPRKISVAYMYPLFIQRGSTVTCIIMIRNVTFPY